MSMQTFFERMARTGEWSPALYEGGTDLRTYNFVTRRECVARLLQEDGRFESALDVGCGSGDFAPIAHDHGAAFFGIDFSRAMIAQALKQDKGRSHYVTGSGERLPYADHSFDLVLALGYIEYFHDPEPPLRELRRVLKPGGTLVIQSFKWDLFSSLGRRARELRRRLLRREAPGLAPHVMRYEDLHGAPDDAFGALTAFLRLPPEPERLNRAIRFSAFDELSGQEAAGSFEELPAGATSAFFRQGRSGIWREALSAAQVARMIAANGEAMRRFGYLDADGAPREGTSVTKPAPASPSNSDCDK